MKLRCFEKRAYFQTVLQNSRKSRTPLLLMELHFPENLHVNPSISYGTSQNQEKYSYEDVSVHIFCFTIHFKKTANSLHFALFFLPVNKSCRFTYYNFAYNISQNRTSNHILPSMEPCVNSSKSNKGCESQTENKKDSIEL